MSSPPTKSPQYHRTLSSRTRIPKISPASDDHGSRSEVQSSKPTIDADLNASLAVKREARPPILTLKPKSMPVRPSRFSIELTPERRERWQRAADIAIPDRERNLAPWLVPLIDILAEIQIAGGDPALELEPVLGEVPRET